MIGGGGGGFYDDYTLKKVYKWVTELDLTNTALFNYYGEVTII